MKVPDLNNYLKSLSAEEQTRLKKRRRRLKNRHYGQVCRSRRVSHHATEVNELRERIRRLTTERDYYREQFERIQAIVSERRTDGIVFNC